jgi:hypothetical protein
MGEPGKGMQMGRAEVWFERKRSGRGGGEDIETTATTADTTKPTWPNRLPLAPTAPPTNPRTPVATAPCHISPQTAMFLFVPSSPATTSHSHSTGVAGGQPPVSNDHRPFIGQSKTRKKRPAFNGCHSAQGQRGFLSAQKFYIMLGPCFQAISGRSF